MKKIAFLSEKGGVAKTTSTLNVASILAKRGYKVLVVDCDPQANSSFVLQEGKKGNGPTLSHVLLNQVAMDEAIVETHWDRVSLCPADATLSEANLILAAQMGREKRLRSALAGLEQAFDFGVFDCSPQRSLLTVNVLNAVDEVIVPVDPGIFSMTGLATLEEAVDQTKKYLDNQTLKIAGLLLTRIRKDNVCREVESQLRELYPDLVLEATIPHSVKLEEAHSRFQSIREWSPKSAPSKSYSLVVDQLLKGRAA
jgi:chromosome partitioning protein